MSVKEGVASAPNKGQLEDATTAKRSQRRDSIEGGSQLIPLCTQDSCSISGTEKNKLQCTNCNRFVHLRCTALPTYQIVHFQTKGYRNFICTTCTVIPDSLKNITPKPPSPVPNKEVSNMHLTLKQKEIELNSLAETNRFLSTKIKDMTNEMSEQHDLYKKEKNDYLELQATVKTMQASMISYEEKIVCLQNALNSKESELSIHSNVNETIGDANNVSILTDIMSRKFDQVEKNLKDSILKEVNKNKQLLEEKIDEVMKTNRSWADCVQNKDKDEDSTNITSLVPQTHDLRAIMREEQNEQLAEDNEKKQRACNIIIHGIPDLNSADKNEVKQYDDNVVKCFLEDIGLEVNCKSSYRLGKKTEIVEQSKRPMKIVMQNEQDKDKIMMNLKNLKGNEKYKGVSVTDDHTIKERNTIKEWVEKARAANAAESPDSAYEWKVRGSPKNGMKLKKLKKRAIGL